VPEAVVGEMRRILKEKNESKLKKRKLEALDRATSSKISKVPTATIQPSLLSLINNKKAVDESVARAFYSTGIPFAVINNSHFKQALLDVSKFALVTHRHQSTQYANLC